MFLNFMLQVFPGFIGKKILLKHEGYKAYYYKLYVFGASSRIILAYERIAKPTIF